MRGLKSKAGGDIVIMGGAMLGHALIEADLVDEIGLNVHPILLGRGTPAFHPMARRRRLELIEGRLFRNGCVLLRYAVCREAADDG